MNLVIDLEDSFCSKLILSIYFNGKFLKLWAFYKIISFNPIWTGTVG